MCIIMDPDIKKYHVFAHAKKKNYRCFIIVEYNENKSQKDHYERGAKS